MSTLDLGVYLVTEPLPGLDGVVAAAVAGGAGIVQLRDKRASTAERIDVATRLRSIVAGRVPVIVNDDLEAARTVDGIHVGVSDLHPTQARAALGSEAVVGWSLEELAQLDDTEAIAACTYLAVSPLWATPSKPDHGTPWELEGLREVVAAVDGRLPVVAIGGIDVSNAGEVVAAGADGVAVISAVCSAADPRAAAVDLRRAVEVAAR